MENFKGYKVVSLSFCNDEIESCAVKILASQRFLLVKGIYWPTYGAIHNLNEALENLFYLSEFLNSKKAIKAGDFIINLLNVTRSQVIIFVIFSI